MIRIGDRNISPQDPPYVVAEMSGNHKGELARARELVRAAHEAGADAVKLQTYRADTITMDCDGPEFIIKGGLWDGYKLYDLYEEAHTPWEWHGPLFEEARALGITIFSSPFDLTAVDFLESLGCPAYKIASPEIIDWPLLEKVAATGKPVVVSTGMATLQEVDEAVEVLRSNGAKDIILLHCVSAYPAPVESSNLRRIPAMADRYGLPVGLSDHTMGHEVAIAAVALGAVLIEKHFTLRRADGGVDSAFSLEADELAQLCQAVRSAHAALGDGAFDANQAENQNRPYRRSLYFARDLDAGEVIGPDDIRSIRPARGLPPRHYRDVIGRRVRRPVTRCTPVSWDVLADDTGGDGE